MLAMPWHFKTEGAPLSAAAKTVVVDFEVDYDTIPSTGLRKSYKKIAFPLNRANGPNSPPLTEGSILEQWER